MKIVSVEAIPVAVPLQAPLKMAVATVTARTCILVRLTADDGLQGIGEGVIAPYFTGESLASAVSLVRETYEPLLLGTDPTDVHAIGRAIDKASFGNSATRSAMEIALYDLSARSMGVPLYRLLGGKTRETVPTIWHVSSADPDKDAAAAAKAAADGFRLVKVKVGTQRVDRDVACVAAVRQAVGDDVDLLLDANQGWTVEAAVQFARQVEPYHPLLIEQPVRRDNVLGLAEVRRSTPIVVAADEGVFTAQDLYLHLQMQAVDGVVAKLIKGGGIAGVRQLMAVAETAGIGVHFAGMAGETSVAAAAAVHLATAVPELRFGSGIASHYLTDDVVTTWFRPHNGAYTVPESPGLGVELSDEAVDRLRVRDL
jgi:L-Ala-D/L-Glu epimerase